MQKVVLITGGSRGIGAATAVLLAQHGYRVAVNYREKEGHAKRVVNKINSDGGAAIAIQADVSNESEVAEMFNQLDDRLGTISALVNNAGILAPLARVQDIDAHRIRKLFDINVVGSFVCAREAILRMSTENGGTGGTIINLTSGAARLGAANDYVDYAASKAAIDTFTIGLAKEVANQGIRVNAVRAGFIKTDMHDSVGGSKRFAQVKNTIPMERVGMPEEIAESIYWLLSDKSSYCTGTILDATGGR